MKKIFIGGFFLIAFIFIICLAIGFKIKKKSLQKKTVTEKSLAPSKKLKKSLPPSTEKEAIFVPYWADFKKKRKLDNKDRLIYFGIAINRKGINRQDLGFRRLDKFKKISRGENQWLALRMTDDETNQAILEDRDNWSKIDNQVINFARENSFQGLVLDLEPKGIAFDETIATVNAFILSFHRLAKQKSLPLAVLVYGDLFFRRRPFNLKNVAANSEEVMVMAYDLHKSRGEPGPNFPLYGREKYGYDLEEMAADFLRFVPANKLTVVFGIYGYDWAVDEKKRPLKRAQVKTLNEIKKEFLKSCQWQNCVIKRDPLSQETEINYVQSKVVDDYGYLYPHIVWFEDEKSVAAKKKFLKTKKISSFAYWAWGYY